MNFQRLHTLLSNIMPYVVRRDDKQPAFFFVGGEDGLLAITHDGLFSQNAAEAFRLTVVKQENDKYQLVYQAQSLGGGNIISASQQIEFGDSLVLFDGLDRVEFGYYGWRSFKVKGNASGSRVQPQWYSVFSGLDKQITPEKITLTLTQGSREITLSVSLDRNTERWLSPYFDEDDHEV